MNLFVCEAEKASQRRSLNRVERMNGKFSRQAVWGRVEREKQQPGWEREFNVQKQETGVTGIVLGYELFDTAGT